MKNVMAAILLGILSSGTAAADVMFFDYSFVGTGYTFVGGTGPGGNDVAGVDTDVFFNNGGGPVKVADLFINLGSNFIDVVFDFTVTPPLNTSFVTTLNDFQFPMGETLNSISFNAGASSGSDKSGDIMGSGIVFAAPGTDLGSMGSVNYRFDFDTTVLSSTAVPEPSSFAICFIGGLAAWRIRRKRAA